MIELLLPFAGKLLDKFFPDPAQKAEAQVKQKDLEATTKVIEEETAKATAIASEAALARRIAAEARRRARFFNFGHTPGVMAVPTSDRGQEHPRTLDLRRFA